MNLRKITSLTLLLSFGLCILTSVILFIVPHGRVAYWSNWQLWGLNKTQWSNLHINLGLLFLLTGILHTYYNWKPITAYLKDSARRMKLFTINFNLALILTLAVGLGTYFQVPPLSTVQKLSESIKIRASIKFGEPPYGHAELSSLKMLAQRIDLDLAHSIELLRQAGLKVQNENQTINDIAQKNRLTPKEIYTIIKPTGPAGKAQGKSVFPDFPTPGFGHKKLAELCSQFNLDLQHIIRALSEKGIKAKPEQRIKEIATENHKNPMLIFAIIKEAANAS